MATKVKKTATKKLAAAVPEPVMVVKAAAAEPSKEVSKPLRKKVVNTPVVVEASKLVVVEASAPAKKLVAKSPAKLPAKASTKAVAKSPAKSPTKSPAKKKATKKVAKSPAKKVAKSPAKKSKGKVVAKKSKGKGKPVVKKAKNKRAHNVKPATMDTTGIGIGPARVKAVLTNISLNPREYAVRRAILDAENKPKKPKPTEKDPDPKMPEQGPQVTVNLLPEEFLSVIQEAEALHEASLLEAYERKYVSDMDEKVRSDYLTKRKNAQTKAEESKESFSLNAFNTSFDSKFYNKYNDFKNESDSYVIGKLFTDTKTGETYEKYNEWTRANALVNKLCTRLSGNTRNIIACFLDRIVEQYARNGIHNCILEGRHIIQLRHALTQTEGFTERVPLNPYVSTLNNYASALDWIESCHEVKERVKQLKADGQEVDVEQPSYNPDSKLPGFVEVEDEKTGANTYEYQYNFDGYVSEICRSVKMQMADEVKSDEDKAQFLETSVSHEFKKFCSYIVYEAILRIGSSLRLAVDWQGVKTISDAMVHYVLQNIHAICGIDYKNTDAAMAARLVKFAEWKDNRKADRKKKRESKSDDQNDDDDDLDDDAPDVPEEVEEEAEEEAEEEEVEVEVETDENAEADADAEAETEENAVEYEQE